jgi:hypothetical protein
VQVRDQNARQRQAFEAAFKYLLPDFPVVSVNSPVSTSAQPGPSQRRH